MSAPASPGSLAVIGLGNIGSGIAASMARSGRRVLGVDPGRVNTPDGVERVGLRLALTEAAVIVLSLPGSDQVAEVLAGADGLLEVRPPGDHALVVDASTCEPTGTRDLARVLAEHGHVLVDAPVSGGASGAADGTLTVFLGCPDEHLDRVRAVLEPVAATINHVGATGAGHTAKLVNNMLCAIHLAAAREALAIAAATGVDAQRLLAAVNTASGRSAVTEVNLPRWVLSGGFDSGFPAALMARDVGLAAHVADEHGLDTPLAHLAATRWEQLCQREGGTVDFNTMAAPHG